MWQFKEWEEDEDGDGLIEEGYEEPWFDEKRTKRAMVDGKRTKKSKGLIEGQEQ